MNYCPVCGGGIQLSIPRGDDRPRAVCVICHAVHYENPRVLVGVVLYCRDKLLWTRRGIPPRQGMWAFPNGFVEKGESLREAAARELREETFIELDPKSLIPMSIASVLVVDQIYMAFRRKCHTEIAASITEETSDWAWLTEEDAPWDDLAFPETATQIRNIYGSLRKGNFTFRIGEISENGAVYDTFDIHG